MDKKESTSAKRKVVNILGSLGAIREGSGVTVSQIEKFSRDELGNIGGYLEIGLIRQALTELGKEENVRKEKEGGDTYYYLARPLRLIKKELYDPTDSFLRRTCGSIFILVGFGVVLLRGVALAGHVISLRTTVPNPSFILSFMLTFIGMLLYIKKN